MAISAEIKYRLNRLFGQTPTDVQLGDLLDAATTVDTADITAGAVTKAKLATGISANFMVVACGNFTTVGGDVNESIVSALVLGTDTAIVNVRTPGAVPVDISTVTPGAGSIAVVMSADPSNDHVLSYIVLRATT